jgi:hypothetical protein
VVTVTDAAGRSASATVKFTTLTAPTTPATVPTLWLYVALAAFAAAAVFGVWSAATRRSRSENQPSQRTPGHAGAGFAPDLILAGSPESVHEGEPTVAPYWEAPQPTETTCRRCGTVMPPGSRYCGRCAIPLDGSGPNRPVE